MSSWQPLCMKQDFGPKTPVCASCKKTNRTRTFCRERHKHRHLPWSTVYVILSAVDSTDPSTIVAAPSHMINNESKEAESAEIKANTEESNEDNQTDTDDIFAIEPSRTFLAQVSCKSNTIHWLQEMEGESIAGTTESDVKALNEAIRSPAAHPEMHQMPMPPQPYYPMMSPQQQQHYFQQQQQQFAAWHAQYGQHMMMPHPMMPIAPMVGPPPPHPPPQHFVGSPPKGENDEGSNDGGDGHAPAPALDPPNQNSEDNDDNVQSDFNTNPAPTTVSYKNNEITTISNQMFLFFIFFSHVASARCTSTVACTDDVSAADVSPTFLCSSAIHGSACSSAIHGSTESTAKERP